MARCARIGTNFQRENADDMAVSLRVRHYRAVHWPSAAGGRRSSYYRRLLDPPVGRTFGGTPADGATSENLPRWCALVSPLGVTSDRTAGASPRATAGTTAGTSAGTTAGTTVGTTGGTTVGTNAGGAQGGASARTRDRRSVRSRQPGITASEGILPPRHLEGVAARRSGSSIRRDPTGQTCQYGRT